MKRLSLYLITMLSPLMGLHAQIEIPEWAFKSDQLAEAQEIAQKKKIGIAFVFTDLNSSQAERVEATNNAFQAFKKTAVTVVIDSRDKNRWQHLSPPVVTTFSEPEMRRFIPRVVISSSDMTTIWSKLADQSLVETEALKKTNKRLKAIFYHKILPSPKPTATLDWQSSIAGRSFKGVFVKIDGEKLVLKQNEKELSFNLSSLSPGSIAYAKDLAAGKGFPVTKHQPEEWKSAQGKTITATFLSFDGKAVLLLAANEKVYKLPLKTLSVESQERAKALAKEAK